MPRWSVGASVVVCGAVVVGDAVTVSVCPGGGAGASVVTAGPPLAGAVVVTVVVPAGVVSPEPPTRLTIA